MSARDFDPDNPAYGDDDNPAGGADSWGDPEAHLMRLEKEEEAHAESPPQSPGALERLDELLADFRTAERRMFWLVFVEGSSVAAAGREAGVPGNVHAKFRKMMAAMRARMG